MRFSLLGTTRAVHDDGSPVALGGARLRALLTVLAERAGRTVPVAVLVDEVWAGDPPADAPGAVQALVGRLRRALGHAAVASAEGGYRLVADADDVDLHRFERLTAQGVRALADGRAADAAAALDEALALWRGPALADLPDRTAAGARWESRRLDARRARLGAALVLGRAEEALPELTGLCEAHPLDESLHALRIRALRDTGRAAQALAAYEEVRRDLADRLGTDPGPELTALHTALLRPRRAAPGTGVGVAPGPAAPGAPAQGAGVGFGPSVPGAAPAHAPDTGHSASAGAPPAPGTGQPLGPPAPGAQAPDASAHASGATPAHAPGAGHSASAGAPPAPGSGQPVGPPAPGAQAPDARHSAPASAHASGATPAHAPDAGHSASAGAPPAPGTGQPVGPPAPGAQAPDARHSAPASPHTSGTTPAHAPDAGHSASAGAPPAPGSGQPVGPPAPGAQAPDARHSAPASAHASGATPAHAPDAGHSASAGAPPAPGSGQPVGPPAPGAQAPDARHSAPASAHASGATPAHAPDAGHSASAGAPPAPGTGQPVGPPAPGAPHSDAPAPGAPHPDAPAPRGNLRARLTSFVGREPEVRALTGDLEAARLVTLLGPGGAGKTRLSQEVGEALAGRWPDGVWLAELAPVDDPATVPEAVLTAVGGRETVLRAGGAEELRAADRHGDDATTRLTEHCARRRMLLLLDNCEHVVDAAAALAQRLLEECPGLTVLATSREPLGVPGELLRPVDPLPDPMAVRLFAERGASARPGFRADADEETASAVAEICRRLDGMPLAIELAAARLRMLTPRQIADRLDDRFRLLTTGSRTVLPRQQTLRAVVDWSWDLLADDERAVLRRLSVFAGGCDLEAAESVCAATAAAAETAVSAGSAGAPAPSTRLRAADVAEAVGALVDKSLVVAEPADDGRMRYRLLETVAEYAGERLDEAGERAGAEWRHLVHYRELARTTDPELRGHGQQAALGTLRREYENLRAAVRRAVARGAEQEALCLVISLSWYWQMRDLRSDARQWTGMVATLHEDPFASPPRPAPPLTARCTDEPPPFAPEMLAEARRQVALIRMVSMDYGAEDWTAPDRTKWLESVVGVYDPGLPQACRFPASLWFYAVLLTGDGARVGDILDESVRTAEAAGHPWDLAVTLQQRANLLANRAQWAGDALRDADRSLEIFERLGDAWGIAEALSSRAEAHERRGEFERAAADCRAAITHARRVGVGGQVDLLRARLANTLAESGHTGEAEAILRDVVTGGGEAAHEALPAARLFLAVLLGRTGRTGESREQLRLLSEDLNGETLVLFQAMVTGMVAWLDLREGLVAEALAGARAALVTAMEPLSMTIAPQLPAMHVLTAAGALIALDTDAARRGARLVGAHAGLLPPGHVATVTERDDLRRVEDAARARLGDDFAALYEEGAALTLEEAAALVRAPQGPATD